MYPKNLINHWGRVRSLTKKHLDDSTPGAGRVIDIPVIKTMVRLEDLRFELIGVMPVHLRKLPYKMFGWVRDREKSLEPRDEMHSNSQHIYRAR
jgi:hypothetical protein